MFPLPDGRIVVPWYSARLFARLRRDLVDGANSLPGRYEQWAKSARDLLHALHHKGHVVVRFDADVDVLDAYLSLRFEEADYGSWREYLSAVAVGALRP